MTFQSIGDLAASQISRTRELMECPMNRNVYQEMKRLLGVMDKIKDRPTHEQVALIRAHVAATAQEAAVGDVQQAR